MQVFAESFIYIIVMEYFFPHVLRGLNKSIEDAML